MAFCCGRTKLIIDWHNYGFTIMQSTGTNKYLCQGAKIYEGVFGRMGDRHLAVSKAFRLDISTTFGIPLDTISVLYDRAVAGKFKKLTIKEKHELFGRINMQDMFTEEASG